MRNVLSIINTELIFALKELLLSVTRLTYAARRTPMPNNQHSTPDKIPITANKGFEE